MCVAEAETLPVDGGAGEPRASRALRIGRLLCESGLRASLAACRRAQHLSPDMVDILEAIASDQAASPRDRRAAAEGIVKIGQEGIKLGLAVATHELQRERLELDKSRAVIEDDPDTDGRHNRHEILEHTADCALRHGGDTCDCTEIPDHDDDGES